MTIRDANDNLHSPADGRFTEKPQSPAETGLGLDEHVRLVWAEIDVAKRAYRKAERQLNESVARGVARTVRHYFPDASDAIVDHDDLDGATPIVYEIVDADFNVLYDYNEDSVGDGAALTIELRKILDELGSLASADEDVYEAGARRGVIHLDRWTATD
ncbi:hypothetical protein [Agromyces humi]|uniref:hypothetical protein n=1 Tax=Agromyces humi TaxID=1766800 RepID=UPI001357EE5C|nr:hypothetical protein [Agromyces humi]